MLNWIKNIFNKKSRRGNSFENEEIQAEALERSREIKDAQHQVRMAEHKRKLLRERQKLQEIQDEIASYNDDEYDEDSGSEENAMMKILSGALIPSIAAPLSASKITPEQNTQPSLSDDEIKAQLSQFPKDKLKQAKAMPDLILASYAKRNFAFDDDTIQRAIYILKNINL